MTETDRELIPTGWRKAGEKQIRAQDLRLLTPGNPLRLQYPASPFERVYLFYRTSIAHVRRLEVWVPPDVTEQQW